MQTNSEISYRENNALITFFGMQIDSQPQQTEQSRGGGWQQSDKNTQIMHFLFDFLDPLIQFYRLFFYKDFYWKHTFFVDDLHKQKHLFRN